MKRAWETGSIAQRLGLTRLLYDPTARGREASEEHCRDENERLTNGSKTSEIGKTLQEIEDLVRKNPNMDILMTSPKSLEEMTLKEVLAQEDSTIPHDKYRALQRKLQIQRENAVAEYRRCMGMIAKPVAVIHSSKDPKAATATATTPGKKLKDVDLKKQIDELDLTLGDVIVIGYSLAGILLILSILFAVVRLHKVVNVLFYMALICAIATTILWFVTRGV